MSLLFESICVKDGEIQNFEFHQWRMRRSQIYLFGKYFPLDFSKFTEFSHSFHHGTFKCKVFYEQEITKFSWENYIPKAIDSLKIVKAKPFDYRLKYSNRSILDELSNQRGGADDILISVNGRLTDCSYANVALFDGSYWYTPKEPLLKGTKRQSLIEHGQIRARNIYTKDIKDYSRISLINAMLDLGQVSIPTNKIIH